MVHVVSHRAQMGEPRAVRPRLIGAQLSQLIEPFRPYTTDSRAFTSAKRCG
jgi:hypothetical protein